MQVKTLVQLEGGETTGTSVEPMVSQQQLPRGRGEACGCPCGRVRGPPAPVRADTAPHHVTGTEDSCPGALPPCQPPSPGEQRGLGPPGEPVSSSHEHSPSASPSAVAGSHCPGSICRPLRSWGGPRRLCPGPDTSHSGIPPPGPLSHPVAGRPLHGAWELQLLSGGVWMRPSCAPGSQLCLLSPTPIPALSPNLAKRRQ